MNPLNIIWGCHFHIDTDDDNLMSRQLLEKMYEYLYNVDVDISSVGVFTPGFGPHTQYDHEIRLEEYWPLNDNFTTPLMLFQSIGYGTIWTCLNNNQFVFSLHALTYCNNDDRNTVEAIDHQKKAVWLAGNVHPKWDVDFFLNPNYPKFNSSELPVVGLEPELIQTTNPIGLASILIQGNKLDMLQQYIEHIYSNKDIYNKYVDLLHNNEGVYQLSDNTLKITFKKIDTSNILILGLVIGWLMENRNGNVQLDLEIISGNETFNKTIWMNDLVFKKNEFVI